jgi:hypothetical protein
LNSGLYIISLYGTLKGKVRTGEWVSESFEFRKGVFQGDPLSPIIFLICFNPIIEKLKEVEDQHGYNLNGERFITLPFADDFNLVTSDKQRHQILITKLQTLTSSMGLKIKPTKCKSISIRSGKSVDVEFKLGDSVLKSIIHEKCHKFVGGFYTFESSGVAVSALVLDKFKVALENIDSLLVRDEMKVRIYSEYFLPSNRFLFSVHDLNLSQLRTIEELTHCFLKKWLGMPQCSSWCLVHDRHGLCIKSVTHMYKEARSLSLANIRFFSDSRVRHALDSKEGRESKWNRKYSSAVKTRELISDLLHLSPDSHPIVPIVPLTPPALPLTPSALSITPPALPINPPTPPSIPLPPPTLPLPPLPAVLPPLPMPALPPPTLPPGLPFPPPSFPFPPPTLSLPPPVFPFPPPPFPPSIAPLPGALVTSPSPPSSLPSSLPRSTPLPPHPLILSPALFSPTPTPLLGPNPALDISCDSLSSHEEATAEDIISAPLRRNKLKQIVQRRFQDQTDSY